MNSPASHFKKKICLLGNFESYKNEFQKSLSSNSLPIKNKDYIGVNISEINFFHKSHLNFDLFLWNIDCSQHRAFLRPIFYAGAEAIIVFISEMRVDQILRYMNEIKLRTSVITIVFCIILENFAIDEIFEAYFKTEEFKQFFQHEDFKFRAISGPAKIFKQICSISLKNMKKNNLDDHFIIDFVPLKLLVKQGDLLTRDTFSEYYEPEINDLKIKQRVNTQLLSEYLKNIGLGLDLDEGMPQWIRLKNEKCGTFSLNLKNGRVYLFPNNCEMCKNKNCVKYKKAPHFICIESETVGWSNIEGLNMKELLIISTILALRDESIDLPESITQQIKKVSACIKKI